MITLRAAFSRRLPGAAAILTSILILAAAVSGCTSSASSSESGVAAAAAPAAASASASAAALGAASSSSGSSSGSSSAGTTANVIRGGQELIYTAQLSVRAASVDAAISRATSIVTAAGGYVSAENAAAGKTSPSQATATVTFKIPAAAYPATLNALAGTGLGARLSLSQQAQDVTQQVADVSSRVTSDQAAITQLRALLAHAGTVGDLLSVQEQINAEETDLESMLAQQNALDHETAYATVTLTLVGPQAAVKPAKASPPPGLAGGLSRGWHAFRLTVSWLLTVLGAVAPFAVVLVVVGALIWWIRRRRQHPAAGAGD